MTTIYSPADKGFDERLAGIDRCQVALLRELTGQFGGGRLILKGGMAMRAVFGSMRLTKDIDFDRDESLPIGTIKKGLPKGLSRAASNAGIREPVASITKATDTTVRGRLEGVSHSGIPLRFEVEISGRGVPPAAYRRSEVVVPPAVYGIAPFTVESYTNDMLAAMKISAAMSTARNAPRDIYDLRDLILAGANPTQILASQDRKWLDETRDNALEKLGMITADLAREELAPYLPPGDRSLLSEEAWLGYTVQVAQAIEGWCAAAIERQATLATAEAPLERDRRAESQR